LAAFWDTEQRFYFLPLESGYFFTAFAAVAAAFCCLA
jgi:hypothetical protein